MSEILNAFEEISNTSSDSLIRSECKSLENEIGSYEFILSIIIWYDILVYNKQKSSEPEHGFRYFS